MKLKKNIIINFNGPIVDSFENTLKLTQFEFPGITENEVRNLYDKNIFISLKELGEMKPNKKELDEYFQNIHNPAQDKLDIIPGMKDFFDTLSNKVNFSINSSGDKTRIKKVFDRFRISEYFVNILDKHDSNGSKKGKFEKIISNKNESLEDIVFITDKVGDMIEAKNSGIKKIIFVTWGYQKKKHLEKYSQDVTGIVDTPQELIEFVRKLI